MLDYNKLCEIEDSFSPEPIRSTKLREKTTHHKQVRVRQQTRFIKDTDETYN